MHLKGAGMARTVMGWVCWLGVLLWLGGCTGGSQSECSAEQGCEFGELCIEGQCISGRCSTSSQCPMEYHCSQRNCVAGCEADTDCLPGFRCDTDAGSCVDAPCVDSSVDCGFREFCNTLTGECYDAGGQYCKPCDRDNEELDCGSGNVCFAGYCGVDCSEGRECPSGFDCYPFQDETGNIVTWQCITYCWLYEDYDPGAFAKSPPPYAGLVLDLEDSCPTDLPLSHKEL